VLIAQWCYELFQNYLKAQVLKNNNVLPEIKDLALNKKPPFDDKNGTEKGFKDALIYFSVLEYLQKIPNKKVFVCVKDGRLKEAFKLLFFK
jgi:hypothetical protein